jgi:hypothetical protein
MIETMSLAITNLLLTLPIGRKRISTFFYPLEQEVDTELILHLLSVRKKSSF